MTISELVQEAIRHLSSGDPEQALVQVSIAIDKTSQQECPTLKQTGPRYKQFLHDNLQLIGGAAIGIWATGFFRVNYRHPEITPDAQGYATLEQIVYHAVRCGLLHAGELPKDIQFTTERKMRVDPATNSLLLPYSLIIGLVLAVVGAPTNADQTSPADFTLRMDNKVVQINNFWGNKPKIATFLRS